MHDPVTPVLSARPLQPPSHTLAQVVAWLAERGAVAGRTSGEVEATGISLSTERVQQGDIYLGLPGARAHGADFVDKAVAAGAVAMLTDADKAAEVEAEIPVIGIDSVRSIVPDFSQWFYAHPASDLTLIAITGTHGKTTTSRLLQGALMCTGTKAAAIGTVGTKVGEQRVDTKLTTPEAPDLQALFAVMREQQTQTCVMEVSSHALVLGRVDGVDYDVAVFTNLGRDHLDFHADMEDYFQAKARLFTREHARSALINVDDEWGRRLAQQTDLPVQTMSVTGEPADWRAVQVVADVTGSNFILRSPDGGQYPVRVQIPGEFNVANGVAALASAAMTGHDLAVLAPGLAQASDVPGRLEQVGTDPAVFVDYAHKPDAVRAALLTLRPMTNARLVIVIGAGGERDRGKRPLMGEIAAEHADLVIITDDNPRGEDPAAIRAELLAGAKNKRADVLDIAGRREAIRQAIAQSGPGDVIIVAGKGHETGQEIDGVIHPFDDRAVVREELAAR